MERKKTYLLTGGLVPLLQNRHHLTLSDNTKQALRELERAYFNATAHLLDGRKDHDDKGDYAWELKFKPDGVIEEDFGDLIESNRTSKPLISFDDVYCQDMPDGHYHVTRIQNPNNLDEDPVLGARFKSPSLENQVQQIKKRFGDYIDIMNIGTFEGGTIGDEVSGRFKDAGIKVGSIYLAYAGEKGVKKLHTLGADVKCIQTFDWVDWLEMRDCLGFDGRKVPMKAGLENPENLFVRYVSNSGRWASIPEDVKEHYEGLYHSFFSAIKSVLACDGIKTDLRQSKDHNLVYELRLEQK